MSGSSSKRPKATLFDVCRETGLSTATVSRVLNGSDSVSAETRLRVERAMTNLGYVPNYAARALAGQRQRMVGVVFPEIGTGFWAEILVGLDAAAAESKFHLLTAFSHGGDDERDLVLRLLREGRIDSLVLMNMRLTDEFAKELKRRSIPLCVIDRPLQKVPASSVTIDNIGGAVAAMNHLYEHGYKDIGILSGDPNTYDSQQRLEGCRRAAAAAGLPLDDAMISPGAFTEECGRTWVERRLAANQRPPRALFCFNDNLAIGALEALREAGYGVPDEVAVVGFDDTASARHLGLTSVTVPLREIGQMAAKVAIEAIGEDVSPRHVVMPVRLSVRRTCGCSAKPR